MYNADFQIQQMERKVARANGERSQEELQKLTKEIADLTKTQDEHKGNLHKLVTSNKQL